MKLGFAITSSFCTLDKTIELLEKLQSQGYDIYPIVSENLTKYDTRFGKSQDFLDKIEQITKKRIMSSIIETETFGNKNKMDAMIVMPATGNFIAKLANGITDNPVNLAVKATLRNEKPIILAISTNDGLSLNGKNIMDLYNRKNIFIVPFGQDDSQNKPNSLISHYDLLIPTLEQALKNKQIQPILKEYS